MKGTGENKNLYYTYSEENTSVGQEVNLIYFGATGTIPGIPITASNFVLSADFAYYIFEYDVNIQEGACLTIKPGTTVCVGYDVLFTINGVMNVEGIQNKNVTFHQYDNENCPLQWTNNPNSYHSDCWDGFEVNKSGALYMQYAHVVGIDGLDTTTRTFNIKGKAILQVGTLPTE